MVAAALSLWSILLCACIAVNAERPPAYNESIYNGTFGSYPVRRYRTEGQLRSPEISWLQYSPECDDGRYNFIAPKGNVLYNPGPMILDDDGELIWSQFFDNPFGGKAYGFRVQEYQGDQFLTFWTGNDAVRGHGAGIYYMVNSSYDVVHQVNAAGGLEADLHEFLITPQGTALITIYDRYYTNLTSFRSFNETEDPDDATPNYIWDCLIQEVSVHTGKLLFEWRVSEHINLTETHRSIDDDGTWEVPWDWFHLNSVAKDELGNYLISARFTNSVTYINGRSGEIIWTLGGKSNDFVDIGDGMSLTFGWQHDARFHDLDAFPEVYSPSDVQDQQRPRRARRLMTLFDNAVNDDPSRGLLLELTYPMERNETYDHQRNISLFVDPSPQYTVRLINTYVHPKNLKSSSQGSMQVLYGGEKTKVLIGYGYDAVWTEFDINGTTLCDAHFGSETSWETGDVQSYRVHKYKWTGQPHTNPKVDLGDDKPILYVSWNGATEVAEWLVQSSWYNFGDWQDVMKDSKRGFETAINLSAHRVGRYLRAVALDKNGKILEYGISQALDRGEVPVDLLTSAHRFSNKLMISFSDNKMFWIAASVLSGLMFAYKILRRLQSWRVGQRVASPIRWKNGLIYRRISGEV